MTVFAEIRITRCSAAVTASEEVAVLRNCIAKHKPPYKSVCESLPAERTRTNDGPRSSHSLLAAKDEDEVEQLMYNLKEALRSCACSSPVG